MSNNTVSHLRRACFPRAVLSIALIAAVTITRGDDWPQWRGPTRDGVWHETGIVEKFDSPKLPIVWRAKIAAGYSGPTVADGRVYVSDRMLKPKQIERVHCFDAKTGEKLWSYSYDCKYRGVGYDAGPRASVTIDDGRAYSLGSMGHLFCFDAAGGKVLWQRDCNEEYKIRMPIWGIAAAPLIEGDLIIVQIGGKGACLVAFDKKTGEEKWRALNDRASYSAPIMIEQAHKRVMVCWTGDSVVGLNAATGETYWKHPFPPAKVVLAVASPVLHRDTLFISGFYDGALLLRLKQDKLAVETIWRRKGASERNTDALHSIISTPYLDGDHIYGMDAYGEMRCLDLMTGDRVWESVEAVPPARWSTIHFVRNADKVWMFNERGELIISRLSPKGFEEISRAKLIEPTKVQLRMRGGVCWSHPAFANRHVFARNDNEIVCASLAK